MEGPVQKLLARLRGQTGGDSQLPAVRDRQQDLLAPRRGSAPAPFASRVRPSQPRLKNAALVYGAGALLLYGVSFLNLASAAWFNGLVLLIPATSLAYLAYRYMVQDD